MFNKLTAAALLATAVVGLAPAANADLVSIGLQAPGVNGGAITTVGSGSLAVTVGPIGYGTFGINSITAFDTPGLGGLPGLLNSNSINTSTGGAGSLNVWVTVQGLTAPVNPEGVTSSFTTNTLPAGWTLTEQDFFSSTGALYAGTPVSSHGFTGPLTNDTDAETALVPFSSGYSFTEEYVISASGTGNTNDTIDTALVPEPGSLALLGSALGGLGLGIRRRRRQPV